MTEIETRPEDVGQILLKVNTYYEYYTSTNEWRFL